MIFSKFRTNICIYLNRYVSAPKPVYEDLLKLVRDKDYFVLATTVDHQF